MKISIGRAIGMLVAALVAPLVILIIYKAIPLFRKSNPMGWYVASLLVGEAAIFVSLSPTAEKMFAAVAIFLIFGGALFRDMKRRRIKDS